MRTNLLGIAIGSYLARDNRRNYVDENVPRVNHVIYRVIRVTQTQAVAQQQGAAMEIRVRLVDGKIIGRDFDYVFPATEAIVEQNVREREDLRRYYRASSKVNDLMGRPLHKLNLNVQQLETLANSWEQIKAMGQQQASA